jgi:transcriptional regulator with GAF, ATPase, and Fis domain
MSTEAKLQRQNERFELLLNLTAKITSSLDLREVLRAIAANIREVIHADAVTVALPDSASEKFRVFAMDFPHGKGVIKEELLITPSAAVKKAMDTLRPVVFDTRDRDEFEPDTYGLAAAEGVKAACNIPLVIAAGPSELCRSYALQKLRLRRKMLTSSAGRQDR